MEDYICRLLVMLKEREKKIRKHPRGYDINWKFVFANGKKLSKVSAIAGETVNVSMHPYSENVYIADTPGLNDVNQEVSKKAVDFVHNDADIIMLFFNSAVGASKPIIDTYHMLKGLKKPIILVLNKIHIMQLFLKFIKKQGTM